MSVIVEEDRRQHQLICKGAVDEVLDVCASAQLQGRIVPLSDELKDSVVKLCDGMNEEGLRVLAVAYRQIGVKETNYQYRSKDEAGLVLAGFIAFLDPPKESIAEALAALRTEGVGVKILTGDSELVARRICKWANLEVGNALLGGEIESLSDAALQQVVTRTNLFAKLTPVQKARVISALKTAGSTVGFLGDGINDAAALLEADVGISVDTAVDLAKEAADIVMLKVQPLGGVRAALEVAEACGRPVVV